MKQLLLTRLDWLVAWRHLRAGEDMPAWVVWLNLLSIYLMVAGGVLIGFAWSLEGGGEGTLLSPGGPMLEALGPTPLQQSYGTFGALTLFAGLMGLTLGILAVAFNLLPTIITMSVLLGCMALVVVLSLMSGLEGDLREKILNQRAHIKVSREDGRPFEDYEALVEALGAGEGIAGASPYLEGEIMVRSGLNRQGAILQGIVPEQHVTVSNLPELIEHGSFTYLAHPEDIPDPDPFASSESATPWRLRHLEAERKKSIEVAERSRDEIRVSAEEAAAGAARASGDAAAAARAAGLAAAGSEADDSKREPPLPPPAADEEAGGAAEAEGWEDPDVGPEDALPSGAPEPLTPDGFQEGLLRALPAPPTPAPGPRDLAYDAEDDWEDPAEILGIDPGAEAGPTAPAGESEPREPDASPGQAAADDEPVPEPLLLGRELSMELGVHVGDDVQLITPVGRITPAGQIPGILGARVAGVFFSGMYEYDRKNVYAPLSVVQRFLLTGDRVSGIEVKLEDVDAIDAGKREVQRIVASIGREDLQVQDWRDLNRNLFSAMFLEKVAMFIALLFVVLVASFGILASNLMSVMEKSKEIAILKAMGMSDPGIMRVFIAEGLCVGLLGSFGGIAMGLLVCWALDNYGLPLNENVYYIEKLPVIVNPVEVTLVGVAAMVIVCISSVYPALVASRLRPVDALRQGDA